MCLAIPMRLTERSELVGTAELSGVRRQVNIMLCPEASAGDYVLVHAGHAIGTVDAVEAERTLAVLRELALSEPALPGELDAAPASEGPRDVEVTG